ncbi:MAG: hypothetical protein M3N95_18750 [Actinomycetota bacterium]|nr:hypothetical protein [Actinomycetota bacterium]
MNRLSRVALGAYPPSFRNRYGDELAALVEDLPDRRRASTDLFRGAARAWLRPPLSSRRGRMQASAATTWVAWCAGFLVAPAINRSLLDPPMAGASGGVRTLLNVAYVLFFVGWALALFGAVPVVVRAVVPAARSRSWSALRPMLPALILGPLEVAGLVGLALTSHGHSAHPSAAFISASVLWLLGFAALICSAAIGPAVTLARLEPGVDVMKAPTWLAMPLALTIAALTGCSLVATVIAGDATLASSSALVYVVLAVGCLASVVALVSSGRAVRTLRPT